MLENYDRAIVEAARRKLELRIKRVTNALTVYRAAAILLRAYDLTPAEREHFTRLKNKAERQLQHFVSRSETPDPRPQIPDPETKTPEPRP